MDKFYDVVIIGAGPAGMGCAVELMKNGVSPCVIDKAVFPRKKTCAGLVTGKTYKLIEGIFDGMDTDGLFCFTSTVSKEQRACERSADQRRPTCEPRRL